MRRHSRLNGRRAPNPPSSRRRPMPATATITSTMPSTRFDPKAVLRPGDAFVEDYRAFQKRIGTSRNVVVQPSTYGTDNRVTLDAVAAFGPQARAGVVVNDTVSDAELKHMHG